MGSSHEGARDGKRPAAVAVSFAKIILVRRGVSGMIWSPMHVLPVFDSKRKPGGLRRRATSPLRLILGIFSASLAGSQSPAAQVGRESLVFDRVEDNRTNGGRSGEGAMVEVADGRVLLMYSEFRDGASDHSPADIVKRYSSDGGRTWSPREVVFSRPSGSRNVMSASLLRLKDGRIGCVILVKWTERTRCIPNWTTSADSGKTWTPLVPMTEDVAYFVGNNDRLIQMQNGTLVFPYALHVNTAESFDPNAQCGIFYSKDAGKTWKKAADANGFRKEWFVTPEPFRPDKAPANAISRVKRQSDIFQEPGVVEVEGGKLMMWARSYSHVYLSYLNELEGKWEAFRPAGGLNVCLGPQTIKRVPGSRRLVMLYNERGSIGYGEPGFSNRTPLSVAVSDDDGKSWKKHLALETSEEKNYCYYSLLFSGDRFLVSYYESTDRTDANGKVLLEPNGLPGRRNLASLKTCAGPIAFFRN